MKIQRGRGNCILGGNLGILRDELRHCFEEEESMEEEGGENEAKRRRVVMDEEMNSSDRLSALPDALLLSILSLLEPVQAGRTCVLSKRWQYLWTEWPKLVFSNTSRRTAEVKKFVDWGDKIIGICSGKHLERFEVFFYHKKPFVSHFNGWVEFAVKNNVKYFTFNSCGRRYELPQIMYMNSSLIELSLGGCIVEPLRTVEWGSLTSLNFFIVDFREHKIEKILSGCPVLSVLGLYNCTGVKSLELNSRSLKTFMISDNCERKGYEMLQISAPYVDHFMISLNVEGRKLQFTDISPYVYVHIEFHGDTCGDKPLKLLNYVDELFANFERAEIFDVGHKFIEVLSTMAVEGWRPPEVGREILFVNTISYEKCIPGIVRLLQSSPYLRCLHIEGNWCSNNCGLHEVIFPDGIPESRVSTFSVGRELAQLTKVTMRILGDPDLAGKPMLRLAEQLLWWAVVLEEMEIEFGDFKDYVNITKALISFKRYSSNAVLTIKDSLGAIIRA